MRQKVKVYLSYHNEDKNYVEQGELSRYIFGLRSHNVDFFSQKDLIVGDNKNERIQSEIRQADVVLTFVSQPYLDSDIAGNFEIEQIQQESTQRQLVVMPVIIGPCDWRNHAWLDQRQSLPKDGATILDYYGKASALEKLCFEVRKHILAQVEAIRKKLPYSKEPEDALPQRLYIHELAGELGRSTRRIQLDACCKKILKRKNFQTVSPQTAEKIRRMYRENRPSFLDWRDLLSAAPCATLLGAGTEGRLLVSVHEDSTAHFWRTDDFSIRSTQRIHRELGEALSLAVRKVRDGWEAIIAMSNGLERWRVSEKGEHTGHQLLSTKNLANMTFSADGTLALVAYRHDHVHLHKGHLSEETLAVPLQTFTAGNEIITCTGFCDGQKYVLAGTQSGKVYIWNRYDGTLINTTDEHAGMPVLSIEGFDSTHAYLSIAERDKKIALRSCFDAEMRKLIKLERPVYCSSRHPDGILVLALTNRALMARRIADAEMHWKHYVRGAIRALTRIGRDHLAVARSDGGIEIRTMNDGMRVGQLAALSDGGWFAINECNVVAGSGYSRFLGFCGTQEVKRVYKRSSFELFK